MVTAQVSVLLLQLPRIHSDVVGKPCGLRIWLPGVQLRKERLVEGRTPVALSLSRRLVRHEGELCAPQGHKEEIPCVVLECFSYHREECTLCQTRVLDNGCFVGGSSNPLVCNLQCALTEPKAIAFDSEPFWCICCEVVAEHPHVQSVAIRRWVGHKLNDSRRTVRDASNFFH